MKRLVSFVVIYFIWLYVYYGFYFNLLKFCKAKGVAEITFKMELLIMNSIIEVRR